MKSHGKKGRGKKVDYIIKSKVFWLNLVNLSSKLYM